MELDKLTIGELRELSNLFGNVSKPDNSAWKIGESYLIRTVTMIDTGKLVAVTEHELVLEEAAWIADTGRFSDALLSHEFSEVEPFPTGQVIIGRGSIVDAVKISKLPRVKK